MSALQTATNPLFYSFCRYPNQMLEIFVRMYLYRWHTPTTPGGPVYTQHLLEVRCSCLNRSC